jgi:hypothetical protein
MGILSEGNWNVFGGNVVLQLANQHHYVLMYGLYSS